MVFVDLGADFEIGNHLAANGSNLSLWQSRSWRHSDGGFALQRLLADGAMRIAVEVARLGSLLQRAES